MSEPATMKNCPKCFVYHCPCHCKTCLEAYDRNDRLGLHKLVELNLADAKNWYRSSDK